MNLERIEITIKPTNEDEFERCMAFYICFWHWSNITGKKVTWISYWNYPEYQQGKRDESEDEKLFTKNRLFIARFNSKFYNEIRERLQRMTNNFNTENIIEIKFMEWG